MKQWQGGAELVARGVYVKRASEESLKKEEK
jgi:hypothetical protein